MEKERKRVCCNCGHCIRVKDSEGMVKYNQCEIDGKYLGYIDTMEGWCRRWCKDHFWDYKQSEEKAE